jgi:hypothetical protein
MMVPALVDGGATRKQHKSEIMTITIGERDHKNSITHVDRRRYNESSTRVGGEGDAMAIPP